MPTRMLKESVNESRGLAEASPFAQDLFKRLITYADDYGRFNGDVQIMRARLYPRELEAVAEPDVEEALIELVGVGKVRLYTAASSSVVARGSVVYGRFPNWGAHQRLRESKPKHPEPESEEVNDWALRRFVPVVLKRSILVRDDYTCQECGRCFRLDGIPVERAQRLLAGVVHFDHVVPVLQGGRATDENLRLLCAPCNLARPKRASLEEMVALALERGELQKLAATRREPLLAHAPSGAGAGNPKERPEPGDVTPPKPPPQAGGGAPPSPRKRGERQRRGERANGSAGHDEPSEPVALAPVTSEDSLLWNLARADMSVGMLPANAEKLEAFEPIGRAPDGGLHLRAPPWADGPRYRQQVARALLDAGDQAAAHVVIVEGYPPGSTEG